MHKLKNRICEAVICAALTALFLVVGAVESFSIGILQGVVGVGICFGVMLLAYGVMLMEEEER